MPNFRWYNPPNSPSSVSYCHAINSLSVGNQAAPTPRQGAGVLYCVRLNQWLPPRVLAGRLPFSQIQHDVSITESKTSPAVPGLRTGRGQDSRSLQRAGVPTGTREAVWGNPEEQQTRGMALDPGPVIPAQLKCERRFDRQLCLVCYPMVDQAVAHILQVGQSARLAKLDIAPCLPQHSRSPRGQELTRPAVGK